VVPSPCPSVLIVTALGPPHALIGGKLSSIADGDSPGPDPIRGYASCTPPSGRQSRRADSFRRCRSACGEHSSQHLVANERFGDKLIAGPPAGGAVSTEARADVSQIRANAEQPNGMKTSCVNLGRDLRSAGCCRVLCG
jgi:hypothetical protein